ncbi:MAG: hypothetical protein M3P32_01540 [Chloroflexota bacterium]|nr:hypothetical protein [Chloroflexota bacterium]
MHPLLRLYPSAWRRRYGEELTDLLNEVPATPATTFDLLRGAVMLQFRALGDRLAPRLVSAGGPPMPSHLLQRHPTATALVAALLLAPTAIFVAVSFVAFELNLPGWAAAVQPFMDGLDRAPRIVDLFLLGAPFLAFLVAALPLVGLRMERVNGELRLTVGVRARTLNVLTLVLAALVGGFLVGHIVSEFLLEAPR